MNQLDIESVSILIVDDDDYQRRVLAKMLGAVGIVDLHQAASGAEALRIAWRSSFCVAAPLFKLGE